MILSFSPKGLSVMEFQLYVLFKEETVKLTEPNWKPSGVVQEGIIYLFIYLHVIRFAKGTVLNLHVLH